MFQFFDYVLVKTEFPFKIFNSNNDLNLRVPATQLCITSLKHRCPKDLISARQPDESDMSFLFQHITDFISLKSQLWTKTYNIHGLIQPMTFPFPKKCQRTVLLLACFVADQKNKIISSEEIKRQLTNFLAESESPKRLQILFFISHLLDAASLPSVYPEL